MGKGFWFDGFVERAKWQGVRVCLLRERPGRLVFQGFQRSGLCDENCPGFSFGYEKWPGCV